MVRAVDEIPENAKFLVGAEIANLVHKFGDKPHDLKHFMGSGYWSRIELQHTRRPLART